MADFIQHICYYVVPPTIIMQLLLMLQSAPFDRLKLIIVTIVGVFANVWSKWLFMYFGNIKTLSFYVDLPSVEDFFYLIARIVFTVSWTSLCTQWTFHSLHLRKPNTTVFYILRYSVLILLTSLMVYGRSEGTSEVKQLCFYLPIYMCLWFVVGLHITRRFIPIGLSIIVSSSYLHYTEALSDDNNRFTNFSHHLIFNGIIVLTSAALDKAKAVLDTFYPTEYLIFKNNNFAQTFILNSKRLFKGLISDEIDFSSYIVDDLENAFNILKVSVLPMISYVYLLLCPHFQDFILFNAFFRVIDDAVDSEMPAEKKRELLTMGKTFLKQLYQGYPYDRKTFWKFIYQPNFQRPDNKIDWNYFKDNLTTEQFSAFRGFAHISWYLPQEDTLYQLHCFDYDTEYIVIKNEADLLEYAECAGGWAVTFPCIASHSNVINAWADDCTPLSDQLVKTVGALGIMFQLIDICEDIIEDSKIGRCFIPLEYLTNDEFKCIAVEKDATKVDDKVLMECVKKMCNLSKENILAAAPGFKLLSYPLKVFILAAAQFQLAPIELKLSSGSYKNCGSTNIMVTIWKVIKLLVFPELHYLLKLNPQMYMKK